MNRRGFFGVVAGALTAFVARPSLAGVPAIDDLPPYLRDFRAGPWNGGKRSIIYGPVKPGFRTPVHVTPDCVFDWRDRMYLIHARTLDGRFHTVFASSFGDHDADIGFGLTVERRTGDLVCVREHAEPTDRIWLSASAQLPKLEPESNGGGRGIHIEKVEIVVKGHDDPSRVARMTVREIDRMSKKR